MKILHAADLHLDSPLRGLPLYDGAPVEDVRRATRGAFENLVALALEEGVELVVLAGDLYDGDWKDYNTGLFFVAQLARLTRAGIRVVLIRGNHDAASKITKSLAMPEGVFELGTRRAETCVLEELRVAVHGQGYARPDVSDDLATNYPEPLAGYFNLGLLHTAINGREGHSPYAPCTVDGLVSRGYQYWALGHVHNREVISEDPWIVFPGNLQGRHARETGPKGASLVLVEDGEVVSVEHRSLDVVRWAVVEIDAEKLSSSVEVVEHVRDEVARAVDVAEGRTLAVRVRISGRSDAHAELVADREDLTQQIRAQLADLGNAVYVEKVKVETLVPLDLDATASGDSPIAALIQSLRALPEDREALEELSSAFDELAAKLPPEYRKREGFFDPSDPDALARRLRETEQELVMRLLASATGSSN